MCLLFFRKHQGCLAHCVNVKVLISCNGSQARTSHSAGNTTAATQQPLLVFKQPLCSLRGVGLGSAALRPASPRATSGKESRYPGLMACGAEQDVPLPQAAKGGHPRAHTLWCMPVSRERGDRGQGRHTSICPAALPLSL